MFAPPPSFNQLRTAQWSGAAVAVLPALGLSPLLGDASGFFAAWLGLGAVLLAASLWLAWLSVFGTAHVFVGVTILAAMFVPVIASLVAAGLASPLAMAWASVGLLGWLAVSTFKFRGELTAPPGVDTWTVFGRKLRLDGRTFALSVEAEAGSSAWQVGVGAVVSFNGLAVFAGRKPGATALLVIAACAAALWCWLCVRLLAPALALALHLRGLERAGGLRFIPAELGALEQARQGHALGRALRRLVPLDSEVLPLRRRRRR